MRVLIDTNVWLSYLMSRQGNSPVRRVVLSCLLGDEVMLVMPEEVIEELRHSATYAHLAQRIAADELEFLIEQIRLVALTPPALRSETPRYSRDAQDDYLIAHAIEHDVDYLITGDRDLLVLERIEGLTILNPKAFESLLKRDE